MAIQDFISQITKSGGIARPNRYAVYIDPPRIVRAVDFNSQTNLSVANQLAQQNQVSEQSLGVVPDYFFDMGLASLNMPNRLTFMCQEAELPGKSFNASDIRTYGSFFQMPFVDVYANITLTFIVGRDMAERDFFDAWSYTIQDPETSDFNYVNEYGTTIDIYQLDEFDTMDNSRFNYACRLYQAWPITIGQMKLAYSEQNSYHVLPITFTYRKWVNFKINSNTPTSITPTLGTPTGFNTTITPQ
jgi:hypothetical protein